jgi:hypothetical protein
VTESIVAAAIASIVTIAVLGGAIAANAHFGPNPTQSALQAVVSRELAAAENLAKYQGAALQPAAVQTTVPLPDGSPIPATLSLVVNSAGTGAVQISITATASEGSLTRSATISSELLSPAPLPGTSITLGGLAPAPTGAP